MILRPLKRGDYDHEWVMEKDTNREKSESDEKRTRARESESERNLNKVKENEISEEKVIFGHGM